MGQVSNFYILFILDLIRIISDLVDKELSIQKKILLWRGQLLVLKIARQVPCKKSHIRETLTLLMCADNSIVSKNWSKYLCPIWNTFLFLRLYVGPIWNRTPGRSMSPIQNTSSF